MAFFDFLKDANTEKKIAGKFLSFLTGGGPTIGGAIQSAVVHNADKIKPVVADAVRSIPRAGVTIGGEIGTRLTGNRPGDYVFTPDDPVSRFVLGDKPVNSFQGAGKQLGVHGVGGAALGIGLTALDAAPVGGPGKKKGVEAVVKSLAKEETEQGIKNILKKVGVDVTDDVARAISKTKDTHVITGLLSNEKAAAIAGLKDSELLGRNYIDNLQFAQGEGAQLPRKVVDNVVKNGEPDVVAAARAKFQAQAKSLADPQNIARPAVGQDIVSATVPKVEARAVGKLPPKADELKDPFTEINNVLTGKGGIAAKSAEQAKILSKERGARFSAGAAAGKTAEGSEGYFKQLGALKGEYTKVRFEPMLGDIGPARAEELFAGARRRINATPDEVYQKLGLHPEGARVNTQRAVRKVLGLEPGLPTKSELKLLSEFSPKLSKQIEAQIPPHRKLFDFAAKVFGNSRSAKSTLDFSMGGRQGLFVAGRHPQEFARANIESVKYAKNAKYFESEMKALHADDWGKLIDEFNPSVLTGGATHEEAYAATDIVGKIPGVKAAERAYTGGLTRLRKDILTRAFESYGATANEVKQNLGDKGIEGLIEAVSTLTGRGGKAGGFVEKHATTLQEALFSPRLWASRLQPLNPAFWKRIGPAGRKEAIQSLGSFAAVASLVLGAAVVAGAEVETDPRSSDFLKIKVGDTRYDILGGFQQNLVFGARQLSGSTKSSTSGSITKFGEKFGGPTRLSSAADLVRNKANPVLGAAANILEGKDKAGNKINPLTEIGQLFVPIGIQGAFNSRAYPKDVLKGLPDFVGIGSQTYGIKDVNLSDKQKVIVEKVKDPEKKKAYTSFFQTAKVASGARTNASEQINKALETNDIAKARQIAKEYNDNYTKAFNEWRKQYKQYSDGTLLKEYNSNKINLTAASVKQRLKVIKEKK